MEWIYGNELSLEDMEMNAWNWKLWYGWMVLQIRFWMKEWYCKLRSEWLERNIGNGN